MPVYNAEEHLLVAINSILEQNFKNFEFIIINDGSTDNSQEIINRRINKLATNKQISYQNQRYYSKKSITLAMVFIKEFLSLIFFRKKPRIKFKNKN